MKKIGILTSGGDAPGMNAAIRAVVRTALVNNIEVVGIHKGYLGLHEGEIFPMDRSSVSDIIQKGGTILKTARFPEFAQPEVREKAAQVLKIYGIEGLVVIGGDGSFRGAKGLAELGIKTIGIPGTIDNDLGYTDRTIGFDTAQNTVIDAINKIRDTSSSHQRVSVVEVMGRDCGDLALYAGLAGGATTILVPEKKFTKEEIIKTVMDGKRQKKHHNLVVIAEGVGNSDEIAKEIEEISGIETRLTVLGHIQRGGAPSAYDRILASRMGHRAVELLMEGKSARVIGTVKGEIVDYDIHEALTIKRPFNEKLYQIAMDLV
ncbi:6-phosphofructokinase [Proteiniclasticum sp. BAD-10]|uniref:ATP-dependent 6-phosphofructokinase n=1 Tax=Proteiniclasticum sediminis TaxID=2804028 RepID=A0A941CRE9_9CLOT|nr:6-phosphofructokinase [Proteiniclasticum sediminis]MBR0577327.1 6-phosphofructokinase [Proteiniclasticum sediminis]